MNAIVFAWTVVKRVTLVAGAFLSFFVLVELMRIFILFHRIHPALAWVYACALTIGALAGVIYVARQVNRYPRPLIPPALPALNEATHYELKRYARYLLTYLNRLSHNRHLSADQRDHLIEEIDSMQGLLHHHPLNEDLLRIIEKSEQELLPPLHKHLKDTAEKEIRKSVRDVMLGVTLSPYHSMDILIVLYRNFSMIFRIIAIYETTPSPRAQWRILRDVVRVVATVNFLYVGRNLIENLFAFVPWVGRVADDIGQGLGAGLFTSATGHAVIDRCSSYHAWEKAAAVESLAAQSRDFLRDVKNIFTKDVLPDIKSRILSETPEEKVREPGFWDNLQKGINSAFDATIRTVGSIIPMPHEVATEPGYAESHERDRYARSERTTRTAPTRPASAPDAPEGESYPNPSERRQRRRRSQPRRGVARVLHTFGQRIKYTLGLGHRD